MCNIMTEGNDLCDYCGFPSVIIEAICGHAACKLCWMGYFAVGACCVDPTCNQPDSQVRMMLDQAGFLHDSMQELFGSDADSDGAAADSEALGSC